MIRQISTIAWITCREAWYGKLPWLCLIGMLLLAGFAEFLGDVVVTGSTGTQAGLVGWGLRWMGVLLLTLFCVNSVTREAADKVVDMLFALPLRREVIYAGKLCGLLVLAFCFALMAALISSLYASFSVSALWALSLFLELAILCALALWAATSTGIAVGTVLVVVAFYLLSRAMQGISAMASGPFSQPDSAYDQFLLLVVDVLSWILPPLYNYASADWLIEDMFHGDLLWLTVQALIYALLLFALALVELYRKQF